LELPWELLGVIISYNPLFYINEISTILVKNKLKSCRNRIRKSNRVKIRYKNS
jgi:hypothetical protein